MHLFDEESLRRCFHRLDGRKAVGADGIRKEDYAQKLDRNLKSLVGRMRRMAYRPGPVREVLIEKDGKPGQYRPLGISNLEDKIVQKRMAEILEALYEPVFLDCSYGFRPGRSCHDAVKALLKVLFRNPAVAVVDIDLKSYFDTISHQWLMRMLRHKIRDRRFMRYVARMLKAGVLCKGEFRKTDEGTPQGSIVSPVLSNIFLHHVLDEWFEKVAKARCRGKAWLIRYADDAIACFEFPSDARRYAAVLPKRVGKFGLKINAEKSRLVHFNRNRPPRDSGTVEFLGFTFHMKKSRRGLVVPAVRTCCRRFRAKLKRVTAWLRQVKDHWSLHGMWRRFCAGIEGHIQYYGVSHNLRSVGSFIFRATQIVFKWLNRRSQRRSYSWSQFQRFLRQFPLPRVRVVHPLFRPVA